MDPKFTFPKKNQSKIELSLFTTILENLNERQKQGESVDVTIIYRMLVGIQSGEFFDYDRDIKNFFDNIESLRYISLQMNSYWISLEKGSEESQYSQKVKIYLNIPPEKRVEAVRVIAGEIHSRSFNYKVTIKFPKLNVDRMDSIVIHFNLDDINQILLLLKDFNSKNPDFFRSNILPLTFGLGKGMSLAQDFDDDSFMWKVAEILYSVFPLIPHHVSHHDVEMAYNVFMSVFQYLGREWICIANQELLQLLPTDDNTN